VKGLGALLLAGLTLTALFSFWSGTFQPAAGELAASTPSDYIFYDLNYVASNLKGLNGSNIATRGLVKYIASVYMYEDFWLQDQLNQSARIPVVVRFANLTRPRPDALIEIQGTIVFNSLEGGFHYLNASSLEEVKNVILIGWDGVQRNHLFELLNRGLLPNLQSLIDDGRIVNVTVSDHRTDTKSGWAQILTGYRWWRTGVFNNVYWFHSIPFGYTIPERVESYFGKDKVVTAHITGKLGHMEVQNGTSTTATGLYTHEAIYSNIPAQVDVCNVGDRNATIVGPLTLQFLENYSKSHFFAFIHFSDPDSAGHNNVTGGENSVLYENAIIRCDNWTGQILSKLNALNISQNTLVYVTADHGFDENGTSHNNAPFVALATNDMRVNRNGDQVDVAPTVYYGLGMWDELFDPQRDGYPLQTSLPDKVEERRQTILADNTQPQKATVPSLIDGQTVQGLVTIQFSTSDKNLKTALLLINNTLKAEGPWMWRQTDTIEVNGSYNWDTTNLAEGKYFVTILAFDEHGATNSPSTKTVPVYVGVVPEMPTVFAVVLFLILSTSTLIIAKRKLVPRIIN
jgi:Type I phosphodiesterase / nucleotide pyrophosphatase